MDAEGEIESFYVSIHEEVDHTPKHGMFIIIGDWNTTIRNKAGPNDVRKFDLENKNKAEEWLTELWNAKKLFIEKYMLQTTEQTTAHIDITRW